MKKILIPIYFLLFLGSILVIVIGSNKKIDIEFYTIKENYSYVESSDRYMNFNVISKTDKPLISYPKLNSYQIKLDSQSFDLDDVECDITPYGEYYLCKYKAKIPHLTDTEYISKTFNLVIINGSYKLILDLGSLSILNPNSLPLIALDKLSGSFSNNNLCGINISLSNDYDYINQFRIGGMAYGTLSRILFDTKLDNEIDIDDYVLNYNPNKVEEDYLAGLKSKTMFIPLGYVSNYFTRSGYFVIKLDNVSYYFDNWSFMTTDPIVDKYKNSFVKGEFINA